MFVYYFANVNEACREIEPKLLTFDLVAWAEEAYRTSEALRNRLEDTDLAATTVSLRVAEPVHKSNHTVLAIDWSASGPAGLFTDLQGDLVVAPIGSSECQISFRGSYRLPSGADRALFHRLSEACVKSFIDHLATALGRPVELHI